MSVTATAPATGRHQADRGEFPGAGVRLPRVIRSEWTKMWSVRSTFWSLLAMVAVSVGISTLLSWARSTHLDRVPPAERVNFDVTHFAMIGLNLGQLAIAVLGVLIISGEYSTGGIRTTLTAVPRRLKVLFAKWLVFAIVALVAGMITAFAAYEVGMIFWAKQGLATHLSDPTVLRAVIGGGLYLAGSGMFGLALGTLLRHSAGAIATAVGLLFVAPGLTGFLPDTWGADINKYFTINAGDSIDRVVHVAGNLYPWQGYAAFTLEWLALLLVGAYLMRRRDA